MELNAKNPHLKVGVGCHIGWGSSLLEPLQLGLSLVINFPLIHSSLPTTGGTKSVMSPALYPYLGWPSPALMASEMLYIDQAVSLLTRFWDWIGPGGETHPKWFLDHHGHWAVEGVLLACILFLFLQSSFKPKPKAEAPLTEKEIDTLCREWQPEPLVPKLPESDLVNASDRIISEVDGIHAVVNGKRVLNLASANFLNLSGSPAMKAVARETVDKYGVGSCGPRGFYGTIDVHLKLEAALASFMGCPSCAIFSFDIATIASVIPACANRKDIVIADEFVSFPIQQGLTLSRAAVHWFKHNDPEDLERVIQRVEEQERREKKPLCRKLVVVEGVYANMGDIAPLDKIYEIKEKYKYRLLVEESFSFGVLGATGRGACEHYGLSPYKVEVICASMGTALGSIGGFCTGAERDAVEHQRLAGSAYVFSASLPPYLATTALNALETMQDEGHKDLLSKLHAKCATLRSQISKIQGLSVDSGPSCDSSAIIHVRLNSSLPRAQQQDLLTRISNIVMEKHGVMLSVPVYSCLDRVQPMPSLR